MIAKRTGRTTIGKLANPWALHDALRKRKPAKLGRSVLANPEALHAALLRKPSIPSTLWRLESASLRLDRFFTTYGDAGVRREVWSALSSFKNACAAHAAWLAKQRKGK